MMRMNGWLRETIRLLCTIACIIAAASMVGYLTGQARLYHWPGSPVGMALNTAVCFVCLGVSQLLATLPEKT